MSAAASSSVLDRFSAPTRAWFTDAFAAPTPAQVKGWDAISGGHHTLLLAPTGSGKTLAAFLWCLDRLLQRPSRPHRPNGKPARREGVSVLYISPLKALSYDIERNLRAPLAGLRLAAIRDGLPEPDITVATRTGDTAQREREDIRRDPPDILITTPESLYLMLTSRSREVLRTVETVIVDEIHTMAATKRGAHLALSLERLEALTARPPQRIGLSATQRPLEEIARYLGGDRHVEIADAGSRRDLDLKVVVPLDDMTRPDEGPHVEKAVELGYGPEARTSAWPALYPELLALIRQHRSTLLFVNNRRLAERLAQRLNELAGEELVRAHHGSIAADQRTAIEEALKSGQIPALVCTSSLELGIDMGAVDLVIQVESPHSVARALQRVGRAGHQVDSVSTGRIFPKFRGDLLECAVLTRRMREGLVEATTVPRNPLDVLAQQIVSMCAVDEWSVDDLERIVRRAYPFSGISREVLENVLEMLAGQYPSDEFAELRPRVIWDRAKDTVTSRGDAKTVAIVNAGTIPDRGLYGVFLGEGGPRVGELDEEMVYETRPGETFVLGASTWRVETITFDRVIVSPAPGQPGKMPFWRGDGVGRPLEFGRAVGAFARDLAGARDTEVTVTRLMGEHDLDERAARNLVAYVADQRDATGEVPSDRTIVVERYVDELGDWRVVILTPFGSQVHAPWALAIEAVLGDQSGFEVQTVWGDDGIAIRFAASEVPPADDQLFPPPEDVEDLVVSRLATSSLFAAHFRENAARALLLPRRRPGARSPLWLQRQRSAALLSVAGRYPAFPIVLETYRECLADVFDLPGLVDILAEVRSRAIRIHAVETQQASPFARSLALDYVSAFMYAYAQDGDLPVAERRAHALALDRDLLRDLLGQGELRDLLDAAAIEETELELQGLASNRRTQNADQLHDLLRRIGDLSLEEVAHRAVPGAPAAGWLAHLQATGRACAVRIAGEERWIAMEDAGRYRDGLGVAPPIGVPESFLRPSTGAFDTLVARFARTHGPFLPRDPGLRWRVPEGLVSDVLRRLEASGTVLHGGFRPGGAEAEWCDAEVLRIIKRRSLAKLRSEVEPVSQAAFARFLLGWQGVVAPSAGIDRLRDAIQRVEGYPLPASILERDVLPARVRNYEPRLLDELGAGGEFAWVGRGSLGSNDGRIALYRRNRLIALAPRGELPAGPGHDAILSALRTGGASFFADLVTATGAPLKDVLGALWDLVWAGLVTNDTLAPLRALAWPKRESTPRRRIGGLPPETAGRWSLTPAGRGGDSPVTARTLAQAEQLLERYGVVARETVTAEGTEGGFAAVYPVFKAMEEGGRIRRGYFVEGLGAAQFALPAAVDRLRAERDPQPEPKAVVLAATDPANPYGASIPWPRLESETRRSLQRAAGALVVLVNGEPALYVERGGRGVITLPVFEEDSVTTVALDALAALAPSRPRGTLTIERIDGEPAASAPSAARFIEAGFVAGYRGLVFRAVRPGLVHA